MGERVYAGLMLFCLIITVGLYFLPRRLSRKRVEVMEKSLHPVTNIALPLMLLLFGGGCLLILLGYQSLGGLVMGTSVVISLAIFIPAMGGYSAARDEIWRQERAEGEKRWKEEARKAEAELAKLRKG